MKKHFFYYLSLSLILLLGLVLMRNLAASHQKQLMVMGFLSVMYVLWGVIHHTIHHNLTSKIVFEYAAIGLLGMSIVFFVLQVI